MVLSIYTLGAAFAVLSVACAQQYTTPVPILRQINKHNEDGSYSYGYEGADGAFKIETKYPNGEVYGKYGYVDDTGKRREIEYGATKRGFEPVGTGITVAPPTLGNNNNYVDNGDDGDDGQYREDPSIYWKNEASYSSSNRGSASPSHANTFSNFNLPAQQSYRAPVQQSYRAPVQQAYHAPAPTHAPQTYHAAAPTHPPQHYAPAVAPTHAPVYHRAAAPSRVDTNQYHGHPASNIDILSGSYTVNYSG